MIHYLGFHKKKLFITVFLIVLLQVVTFFSVQFFQEKNQQQFNLAFAENVREQVRQAIYDKQQATTAIAVMLSSALAQQQTLTPKFYDAAVIDSIQEYSDFKNLWIQIVDKEGRSLFRSWSPNASDDLIKVRPEFSNIANYHRPLASISSGKYDLSIKVVVPILSDGSLLGFVDLISHFNSIQKRFENLKIDTLVLATEERSKLIEHPFSANRLDKHYVANLNPNQGILKRLSKSLVDSWVGQPYALWQEFLVVPYGLEAVNQDIHGHLFSFVPLEQVHPVSGINIQNMTTGEKIVVADILLSLFTAIALGLYLMNSQKSYFKNILNAENDMVLVTDGKGVIDGNLKLFEYFPSLANSKKKCISDYFKPEQEGDLTREMSGQFWLNYVLDRPDDFHRTLIDHKGGLVKLSVKAKPLAEKSGLTVVVMNDITQIESLYDLSRTDALTRAGNRRSFDHRLTEALATAQKKAMPLSLVVFDIDYFKTVNDRYGHAVGDSVLQRVADLTFEVLGHQQILFRIGGEEFAILLDGKYLKEAKSLAEKIRAMIDSPLVQPNVTLSAGVVEAEQDEKIGHFFERADQALYSAKNNGRNKVESL